MAPKAYRIWVTFCSLAGKPLEDVAHKASFAFERRDRVERQLAVRNAHSNGHRYEIREELVKDGDFVIRGDDEAGLEDR